MPSGAASGAALGAELDLPRPEGQGLGVHRPVELDLDARAADGGDSTPRRASAVVELDGAGVGRSTARRAPRRRRRRRRRAARARRAERHPELVERAPRLARRRPTTRSSRATSARLARRRVRLRARAGVRARAADRCSPSVQRRRGTRASLAHADRARGGRRGRGLGAVRSPPTTTPTALFNARRRALRRPRRQPALRLRARTSPSAPGSSAPSAPRSSATRTLDWVALGFGSARRQGADGDASSPGAGAERAGDRRLRRQRPPAPRLRHDPGARRAEHDLRPRLPRRPRATARPRSGAG